VKYSHHVPSESKSALYSRRKPGQTSSQDNFQTVQQLS